MNGADFRLERLTASLLSRRTTLKRLLEMKDQTQRFDQNRGFVFLLRGAERQRVEEELQSVEALLAAAMPAE
ncbi:hypothetical protein [Lysobacter sp. F60174L2]|uniref:hypothetical protein n=1 Tax=Lysobacter sp. F60174L2 TaxID=3459295 RepID=UPI00403D6671